MRKFDDLTIDCPLNPLHKMPSLRLQWHLPKCKAGILKATPDAKFYHCQDNYLHCFLSMEAHDQHLLHCQSKRPNAQIIPMGERDLNQPQKSTWVVPSQEWGSSQYESVQWESTALLGSQAEEVKMNSADTSEVELWGVKKSAIKGCAQKITQLIKKSCCSRRVRKESAGRDSDPDESKRKRDSKAAAKHGPKPGQESVKATKLR